MGKDMSRSAKALSYLFLIILSFVMILPCFWTVVTSFKQQTEILTWPPQFLPSKLYLGNYQYVIEKIKIGTMFVNSLYIAVLTTVGQLVFCSLAGFSFAKLRFRFKDGLFKAYLATMMVPAMLTLIPRYVIMKNIGMVDTHMSLILPALFGGPFGVFLMRQFYIGLPDELMEAARIDGASYPYIFAGIYTPLTRPILSTLAVFSFMGSWNDFLWPLITIQSNGLKTLPIGLASFQSLYGIKYSLLMAGAVLALLPGLVAFLFAPKQFIEGIAVTGLKG